MIEEGSGMHALLSISRAINLVGAALITVFFVCTLFWAFDRRPPFELYNYVVNEPTPGGLLVVHASVRRDLDRECSVKFVRVMYDQKGRRFWESDQTSMSAVALEEMNAKMKGGLDLLVPVPDYAPPGKLTFSTFLEYKCNPIHVIKPIDVVMNIETTIVAKE